MGSVRSVTVGEETGCSDALAAIRRGKVELKSFSGYFSRENIVSVVYMALVMQQKASNCELNIHLSLEACYNSPSPW